jgi:hypothetical protein
MKDLYKLISVYDLFEDVSCIKKFTKKGTLERAFFQGLLDSKFKNDQLASNYLFGSNSAMVRYRMLKSRVREKLFNIVCDKYITINSQSEIAAEKIYIFLKEINFRGQKGLAFYYLKRFLKHNTICVEARIKFIYLLIQIGQETGKFSDINEYVKEVVKLRKGTELKNMILKKYTEYINNRNSFSQAYKIVFLRVLMDKLQSNRELKEFNILLQMTNCLKISYFYENHDFEKIAFFVQENRSLFNIGSLGNLPGNFKILNLVYYCESLIRLRKYELAIDMLRQEFWKISTTIDDPSLEFELVELNIIACSKQGDYCSIRNLIIDLNKKPDCLTDPELAFKIDLISKAIGILINGIKGASKLKIPHRAYFCDGKKFSKDYLLLSNFISVIIKNERNKVSISTNDQAVLKKSHEEYKLLTQKQFLPLEELIDDINECIEFLD